MRSVVTYHVLVLQVDDHGLICLDDIGIVTTEVDTLDDAPLPSKAVQALVRKGFCYGSAT